MAKVVAEEPKYDCGGPVDGTKVYYYFNPPESKIQEGKEKKSGGIKKIVIGAVLAVAGIAIQIKFQPFTALVLLAILAVAAVIILIGVLAIKKGEQIVKEEEAKRVSDSEYDQIENIMTKDIVQKGMEYLNLDEDEVSEAEPLVLHRYDFSHGKSKKGEDDVWRSTDNVMTVFFFSTDTLYTYEHTFSMMNTVTSDSTMTLFYSDIVSVQVSAVDVNWSQEEKEKYNTDGKVAGVKLLTIATTGGQNFGYKFASSDQINRSINAMQSLFRSKKKGN